MWCVRLGWVNIVRANTYTWELHKVQTIPPLKICGKKYHENISIRWMVIRCWVCIFLKWPKKTSSYKRKFKLYIKGHSLKRVWEFLWDIVLGPFSFLSSISFLQISKAGECGISPTVVLVVSRQQPHSLQCLVIVLKWHHNSTSLPNRKSRKTVF